MLVFEALPIRASFLLAHFDAFSPQFLSEKWVAVSVLEDVQSIALLIQRLKAELVRMGELF